MNIPTLPPFFLDRCLALSEHLYAMKSGSARLEASPSHFFFSVDHPPGNKESGRSGSSSPYGIWKTKKKSPSDFKRAARRREEYLERKRSSCQPAASSSNPTQSTDPPTSADLSLISETSMKSDVMETESSEVLIETPEVPVTTMEGAVPVIPTTRNNSESNVVPVNESRNLIEINDVASTIKTDLPHFDNPDLPEKLNEVHILICAPSKSAAKKRSHQFPNSKMISLHTRNKKHHFMFSTNVNDEYITKLKTNINKF